MCSNILKLLKENNVKMEAGLTFNEILEIEKIYGFSFPKSLQDFLMVSLPVSTGFYNWRDKEEKNIDFIKSVMNQPVKDIDNMPQVVYWSEDWGEEPNDEETFNIEVKKRLKQAPKVIPIFSHRYMPITNEENPPIISIHGGDVIYMGENLVDYIEVEFGKKKHSQIQFSKIKPIPFWTDLMQILIEMEISYHDRTLQIGNIKKEFIHPIKEIHRVDDKIIVLLLVSPESFKEKGTIDNIYAISDKGDVIWRSESLEKLYPDRMNLPYLYMDVDNNEIRATDFLGRRYFIDINDGKITKMDVVK